jgi:hypothetical protein
LCWCSTKVKIDSFSQGENCKTVVSKTTAANFEDGSDSIIVCSSSSSELPHQSTLEPKHKVHQWLMANPSVDTLAVTSEEDGENALAAVYGK